MCREIMSYIQERGIKNLYHFTSVNNLDTILTNGLLPLTKLKEFGIKYSYNDTKRLEGKQECICISISFPNYRMFFKYRQQLKNEWCVIELSPRILYEKQCFFCIENAASRNELRRWDEEKLGISGLQQLFYDEDRVGYLPKEYTTNPQAEVLVKGNIETKYIKSINLPYDGDFNSLTKRFKNFNFIKNDYLFKYRVDYNVWRS